MQLLLSEVQDADLLRHVLLGIAAVTGLTLLSIGVFAEACGSTKARNER